MHSTPNLGPSTRFGLWNTLSGRGATRETQSPDIRQPTGCAESAEGAVWILDYRPGLAADELNVTDEPLRRPGPASRGPARLSWTRRSRVQEAGAGGGRRRRVQEAGAGSNGA